MSPGDGEGLLALFFICWEQSRWPNSCDVTHDYNFSLNLNKHSLEVSISTPWRENVFSFKMAF